MWKKWLEGKKNSMNILTIIIETLKFIGTLFLIIAIMFLVLMPFMLLANYLDHKQCSNNVSEMGRGYRYDWVNGCRIQLDDGTFVYWKMYKIEDNQ